MEKKLSEAVAEFFREKRERENDEDRKERERLEEVRKDVESLFPKISGWVMGWIGDGLLEWGRERRIDHGNLGLPRDKYATETMERLAKMLEQEGVKTEVVTKERRGGGCDAAGCFESGYEEPVLYIKLWL